MKQFFKMFFASMMAMVVTVVIIIGVTIGMLVAAATQISKAGSSTGPRANSVLVLDLGDSFLEGDQVNSLAALFDESQFRPGLTRTYRTLLRAREDDRIKGVLLKLNPGSNGWSTLLEIREALEYFRSSGKFVYAYGEHILQGNYLTGSVSDSVFVHPMGSFSLRGLATVIPFFQGALNKLEIEPEIFYAGKFKSATEPFRRADISPENRQQIEEYQSALWDIYLGKVAEHSGKSGDQIHELAQSGSIQWAEQAMEHGLVDGLLYWDELEDLIRRRLDLDSGKKIPYISLADYSQSLKTQGGTEGMIALLIAEGEVGEGEGPQGMGINPTALRREIRKIRENDRIKSVVLRINSPGGSPLAAESIWRELRLLAEEKPLIVSMGDMATSAAYYIACSGDSVFASPATITGSIGVYGMLFVADDFLAHKLGVKFDQVKNAPFADFPTGLRSITDKERQFMQSRVDHIYDVFLDRVAQGRNIPREQVEPLAQGKVWVGQDALEKGLIDGLGGVDRAIASAAAAAGLEEVRIRTYPDPREKFETMIRQFSRGMGSAEMAEMLGNAAEETMPWVAPFRKMQRMNGQVMALLPWALWDGY